MSYTEKIDVLELLIGILQNHEKKLGEITGRLEALNILKRGKFVVILFLAIFSIDPCLL